MSIFSFLLAFLPVSDVWFHADVPLLWFDPFILCSSCFISLLSFLPARILIVLVTYSPPFEKTKPHFGRYQDIFSFAISSGTDLLFLFLATFLFGKDGKKERH